MVGEENPDISTSRSQNECSSFELLPEFQKSVRQDLNLRPHAPEACALTQTELRTETLVRLAGLEPASRTFSGFRSTLELQPQTAWRLHPAPSCPTGHFGRKFAVLADLPCEPASTDKLSRIAKNGGAIRSRTEDPRLQGERFPS